MANLAKISFPDLEKIFTETAKLVNGFSRLFRGIYKSAGIAI